MPFPIPNLTAADVAADLEDGAMLPGGWHSRQVVGCQECWTSCHETGKGGPMRSLAFVLYSVAGAILLGQAGSGTITGATQTIRHPDDGYATIQAAVNAAGCDGTVLLAAGLYNE